MVVHRIFERISKNDWRSYRREMLLHQEVKGFAQALKKNLSTLSISTFGIATALMWNEVIRSVIDEFYPDRGTLMIKVYVALLVTIVSVFATYLITKLKVKEK